MSGWKSFSLGTTEEEEVLVPGTASSVLVETLLSLCKLIDSVTSITTEVKYGCFFVIYRVLSFISQRVLLLQQCIRK